MRYFFPEQRLPLIRRPTFLQREGGIRSRLERSLMISPGKLHFNKSRPSYSTENPSSPLRLVWFCSSGNHNKKSSLPPLPGRNYTEVPPRSPSLPTLLIKKMKVSGVIYAHPAVRRKGGSQPPSSARPHQWRAAPEA